MILGHVTALVPRLGSTRIYLGELAHPTLVQHSSGPSRIPGVQLEGALGSAQFGKLIVLLTLLSQGCTVFVAKLMADQLGFRVSAHIRTFNCVGGPAWRLPDLIEEAVLLATGCLLLRHRIGSLHK
jgi:hypothetical protein